MITRRRNPNPVDPTDTPAGERQVLVEFLDWYRAVLAGKAEGLTRAQMNQTLSPSTLTLAGLVKHLALVEDSWFTERLAGAPSPEPWASAPWAEDPDWDFHSAAADEPAQLRDLFDAACARSRAVMAAIPSLDTMAHHPYPAAGRGPWNLRWILVHMIEEYARHTGHADLLRQAVDGRTGD